MFHVDTILRSYATWRTELILKANQGTCSCEELRLEAKKCTLKNLFSYLLKAYGDKPGYNRLKKAHSHFHTSLEAATKEIENPYSLSKNRARDVFLEAYKDFVKAGQWLKELNLSPLTSKEPSPLNMPSKYPQSAPHILMFDKSASIPNRHPM